MASRMESSDEEETAAQDLVVTKYKMAGDIANRVLEKVVEKTVAGAQILDICAFGDQLIEDETAVVYKSKKDVKKGVAFPTCLSVNNCAGNFSPLKSYPAVTLQEDQLVKIELGVHVDGFIAVVGTTVVVGSSADKPVMGPMADVIVAANTASEIALRMMKPGGENTLVSDTVQKVAREFGCTPVEGGIWHRLKKGDYVDDKCVVLNMNEAMRKEHKKVEFELYEVYEVNVTLSTGDGKTRQLETRTTVYKRSNERYNLKMKASKNFFSEVQSRFDYMPFSLRSFEDEGRARLALSECVTHGLLEPFNVTYEKEGEYVAQFRFTVLLMPNGPLQITAGSFNPEVFKSDRSLQSEELKKLLTTAVTKKKNKKKKKGKTNEKKEDEKEEEDEEPQIP